MNVLDGKRVLVTGGTGSLGQAVVRRILSGEMGTPEWITVFSRDETKQHYMRLAYLQREEATDDIVYSQRELMSRLRFQIGDIRQFASVARVVRDADVVVHAAAMKQVPTCEYFPYEAVQTNVIGTQNLVRAILDQRVPVEAVVGISTDKACKPVNVLGMTKAMMERIIVEANLHSVVTRFVNVRYGNVVASRGSVIPLFLNQIRKGGPITITSREMTRFLLTLDQAVDAVFATLRYARPGDLFVPQVPSARVVDIAKALMPRQDIPIMYTGVRPGEKIHEILVSEEEIHRTEARDGFYVIRPMLPELGTAVGRGAPLSAEYSSAGATLDRAAVRRLLHDVVEAGMIS